MPHYQSSTPHPKNHEARNNTHPNPVARAHTRTNPEARTCTQHDHPPSQTQPSQQTDDLITELRETLKSLFPNGLDGPTLTTSNFLHQGLRGFRPASKDQGWTLHRPDHML